ncbi:MAG: type II toxin-antitoxin system YafQ family toxin [Parabacteroides sp.]|nr:type II toxin-antitoxin system YafQ family toxin [Parabacteroides sp.]
MRYAPNTTHKFNKDFKRCKKRGCNMSLLKKAVDLLCEKGELPEEYHPHKLSGKHNGLWECHIQTDWLLIWEQNDTELILLFTDTGTHSDLF